MLRLRNGSNALMLAGLILMLAGVASYAQKRMLLASAGRPELKMELSGGVERDSKLIMLDKATVLKPGELLTWTVEAANTGGAPAHEYQAVAHIPRGTEYVGGSAIAVGAEAVYSIDGGKSFSPQPTVEQKEADGSTKRVPAPTSMFTDIRYEWADPLAAGGKVSASYQVRVK